METQVLGIKTYYEFFGNGAKTLLIMHGWGNDISIWNGIAKRLSKYFTVYAVDFPSHGGSAEMPAKSSLADFATFTHSFISQMGIQGCHVLAHSFGGRVAIFMAAQDANIFDKMVLTGSAGLVAKKTFRQKLTGNIYLLRRGLLQLLSKLPFVKTFFKARLLALRAKYNSKDYMALSDNLKQTFINIIKKDLSAYLPKIKNDTLLIYGEDDKATPLWIARRLKDEIPNAKLRIMPGDHYCFLKYADPFCDYVLDFLLEDEEA